MLIFACLLRQQYGEKHGQRPEHQPRLRAQKRLPHQAVQWQHTGKITPNHAANGNAPLTPAS